MTGYPPLLYAAIGACAASLASAVWSEAWASSRRAAPIMPLPPGSPPRALSDSMGFAGAAIMAFQGQASAVMGSLAVMATLGGLAALSRVQAGRRWRAARSEAHGAMARDVELRTRIDRPTTICIRTSGRTTYTSLPDNPPTPSYAEVKRIMGDRMLGYPAALDIPVHPLPKSATLRALIAANGTDPMLPGPRP